MSPPPLPLCSINLQNLNLKISLNVEKHKTWRVTFMDANQLAAAGFYIINKSDIVRCAVCGVEVDHLEEGNDSLKEHKRSSPSCGFAEGLCVANIPILSNDHPEKSSDRPTRSRDMNGARFEFRPTSLPERIKFYYLYFFFCYVCVFDKSVLIFNVLLQLQILEHLNTL